MSKLLLVAMGMVIVVSQGRATDEEPVKKLATGKDLVQTLSEILPAETARGKLRNGDDCQVTFHHQAVSKVAVISIEGIQDDDVHSFIGIHAKDILTLTESSNEGTSFFRYEYSPSKRPINVTRNAFFLTLTKSDLGFEVTLSKTGKRRHALTCRVGWRE
ncbi:MAG: hypothetical protein HYR96_05095 [Deltaproteobacteria bacterium]|nr:hypothetical protein [Deltaproteobacteria bacterium]MBI3295488.1 hypothetical protein [Deltaproteobacteria bacterium]